MKHAPHDGRCGGAQSPSYARPPGTAELRCVSSGSRRRQAHSVQCGTLEAEKGVLEASDGRSRRLPAPVRGDGATISGDGWTFKAATGWVIREGGRRGEDGGPPGDRTRDTLIKSQVLYH
jgi:hypothetical protein